MKRLSMKLAAAGTFAAALALAPLSLSAAETAYSLQVAQAQTQEAPSATAGETQFSDETLRAFAEATTEVQKIGQTYQPRLEQAETPAAQEEVRREATTKMVEAVQSSGLSLEEYNEVYGAAESDPQIANRIAQYVQDMR